jgi:hypothetical protein
MQNNTLCKHILAVGLSLMVVQAVQAVGVRSQNDAGAPLDWVPTGKGYGKPSAKAPDRVDGNNPAGTQGPITGQATATGYGISYHGGPVIGGTTNIYYIWYGNWTGNTAPTILTDLAQNLTNSPRYGINTTYSTSGTGGKTIVNAVSYKGAINVNYSFGTALSDASIKSIVANAITSGSLPKDANGVYFVLTSSDVNATSGFCTQYCGWHNHATISGADIKYAFIGNPSSQCPSSCGVESLSPNGNGGADAMANSLIHELDEAVTDPDLNAWYDNRGYENADKCAWTYGTTYVAANGATANMKLGARDFLIQRNWVNAAPKGRCDLKK